MAGWIGVDLDGTLAVYPSTEEIGPPIPAMVARVRRWLAGGCEVRIVTARVSGPPQDAHYYEMVIRAWCKEHIGAELPVTCKKDYGMLELWDDRCVAVVPNTGQPRHEVNN